MLEVVSEHGVFVVLSQASLVVRIRKVGSQQDEGSTKSSCFLLFTSGVQPGLVKECPRVTASPALDTCCGIQYATFRLHFHPCQSEWSLVIAHDPFSLPPPSRYQRRGNLLDTSLGRQQIELRSSVPRILNLQSYAEAIEIRTDSGRKGHDVRAGANNEDICRQSATHSITWIVLTMQPQCQSREHYVSRKDARTYQASATPTPTPPTPPP